MCTVRKALKYVHTKYVIKTRMDTYFSNLNNFINHSIDNETKITHINIYTRGFIQILYHPSDILFGGTYININNIFNSCSSKIAPFPEVNIFKNYIISKLIELNVDIHSFETDINVYSENMSKIFDVYNLLNLTPYFFKHMQFNNTQKSTRDFYKYGCDN
jgi:hypothetical protein